MTNSIGGMPIDVWHANPAGGGWGHEAAASATCVECFAFAAGVASVEIAIPIQATEAAFAAGVASQQAEIERLRAVLERIATFRGEEDLPESLRNGSRSAIRFYVAVEPVRIARAALAEKS